MRLIDADELLKRAIPMGWSTPLWVSDIMIQDAPTIEERKKGKWLPYLEEHHDMFKCSNCGNITRVPFKCFSPPYCYCPYCGCAMEGVKADG